MTITCQPMDATAGAPAYSAQNERQNMAPLYGGGGGVALAARSGFRAGTPSNILTATSTTWTLGPCSAVISPGAATAQGSYRWASDANATGAVTAADATYDRKDIVYIQVSDSSSGDGSGALSAPVSYLAGTPSASPAAPTLPARSFLVGTITVPKTAGGAPTVVLNPAVFVAAGAPQPVYSKTERDGLTAYKGLTVQRMDLAGMPMETYDGVSKWAGPPRGLLGSITVASAGATAATANLPVEFNVNIGENRKVKISASIRGVSNTIGTVITYWVRYGGTAGGTDGAIAGDQFNKSFAQTTTGESAYFSGVFTNAVEGSVRISVVAQVILTAGTVTYSSNGVVVSAEDIGPA